MQGGDTDSCSPSISDVALLGCVNLGHEGVDPLDRLVGCGRHVEVFYLRGVQLVPASALGDDGRSGLLVAVVEEPDAYLARPREVNTSTRDGYLQVYEVVGTLVARAAGRVTHDLPL